MFQRCCIVFSKLFFLRCLYGTVNLVIGLEIFKNAVFFQCYLFICLVNREIGGRSQKSVFPGLSFKKLVSEFPLSGKEVGNKQSGYNKVNCRRYFEVFYCHIVRYFWSKVHILWRNVHKKVYYEKKKVYFCPIIITIQEHYVPKKS